MNVLSLRTLLTARRTAVMLLPLLAIIFFTQPASAAIRWCRTDPIVRLNGVTYQVLVGVPENNVAQIDGELFFEVYSPKGTKQELLYLDDGYNGYGEKVVLKEHDVKTKHTFYLDVPTITISFPCKWKSSGTAS